jgi:hypothetical protein
MKKTIALFMMLAAVVALGVTACEKPPVEQTPPVVNPGNGDDDDPDDPDDPDKDVVELTKGSGAYFGNYLDNGTGFHLLTFYSDDYELNPLTGAIKTGTAVRVIFLSEILDDDIRPILPDGKYPFAQTGLEFTCLIDPMSTVSTRYGSSSGAIASGAIEVVRSGNNYEMEFDIALDSGRPFKGSFEGPIKIQNMNYVSTFFEDVSFPGVTGAGGFSLYGNVYGKGTYTWLSQLYDADGLTPTGEERVLMGRGGVLQLEMHTASVADIAQMPAGEYTIVNYTLPETERGVPGTITGGYAGTNAQGELQYYGSFYRVVEDGYYVDIAPLVSGTATVSYHGGVCTVTLDALDDKGLKIQGDMTGAFTVSDYR